MKIIFLSLIFFALLISCDKQVTEAPRTTPIPIAKIILSSNPSGALIFEDGKNSSLKTPDTLTWLEEKEYKFTLKLNLYGDTTFSVDVQKNETINLHVDFTGNIEMLGGIDCITNNPGANIYLNDSLTGLKTPHIIKNLLPGEYKVKYIQENHRSDSTVVTVKSNIICPARINLIDTTYWVDYIEKNSGLFDNYLTHISIDKNNVKWITSRSQGIINFDGINWKILNITNSNLPTNACGKVYFDSRDQVWLANYGGLVNISNDIVDYQINGGRFSLPSSNICDIEFDSENRIWVATRSGIAVSEYPNYNVWTTYLDNLMDGEGQPDFEASYFLQITVDEKDRVWAGNKKGNLFCFVNNLWTYTPPPPDNSFNYISHLTAKYNKLYVSRVSHDQSGIPPIYGGLSLYEYGDNRELNGMWHANYKRLNGIDIYNVLIEDENNFWVASKKGLHNYRKTLGDQHFHDTNTSFYNDQIADMAIDSNNDLWVASRNAGLYKFKRNK